MQITLEQVKDILMSADIEGFIDAGAPEDEYTDEAKKIHERLVFINSDEVDAKLLATVLDHLWQRSFNLTRQDMVNREEAMIQLASKLLESAR